MKFEDLRKKIIDYPVFTFSDILKWFPKSNFQTLKLDAFNWVKNKNLIRIKKGLYFFPEKKLKDHFILADKIYSPSYISMEVALNYYGIIPDIPQMVTLITPLTSRRFKTHFGDFFYHHIKKDYFWGWQTIKVEEKYAFYNIALPEKALLDFIYFNLKRFIILSDFKEERFEFDKDFNWSKFLKMSKIFKNKKIQKIALEIKKYYAKN
ncbi:hypothetical protein KKA09_01310 [Patescibacteria group bacterium]|nr:hypothetical protein [Patescibacteria group bacterium]